MGSFLRWPQIISKIPNTLLFVLERLKSHGYQGFLVGGSSRNILLGKDVLDWDIATSALPTEIEKIFPHTIPLGKNFGTILVKEADLNIEITTFRQEGIYSDRRHPDEVIFLKDIEGDLARRDFTVNAIALDPLAKKIVDPYQGRRDLKKKILRGLGNPMQKFREDPLRMLRFYRFQASLGFKGDPKTVLAMEANLLDSISRERIAKEMNLLLLGSFSSKGLWGLANSGILSTLFPELLPLVKEKDILTHTIKTVAAIKPILHLRWAALLHDIGKPQTRAYLDGRLHFLDHELVAVDLGSQIMKNLKVSNSLHDKVIQLIRWHMFPCDSTLNDAALRRLINRVGEDNILDLIELRRADIIASTPRFDLAWPAFSSFAKKIEMLLSEEKVFSMKDLAINGHDIIKILKIKESPLIGELLTITLEWVLDDPGRNEKKILEDFLRDYFSS